MSNLEIRENATNEEHDMSQSDAQVRGTSSFLRTCLNGLNALSGIGVLSAPYAIAQGGWLSLVLLLLVSFLCFYTGMLLRRCMETNTSAIKTYPDIAYAAFGYKGKVIISFLLYLELYLIGVDLLILEGDNLDKLFPGLEFHIFGMKVGGSRAFILLSSLLVLPTTWVRSLRLLAYVSAGGVIASLVLVICVFSVGTSNGVVTFREKDGVLVHWRNLPTTLSLFAFSFAGHAVFPTLCSSMKDRRKFTRVLLVSFITSTLTYGSMGIMGYLMYGEYIKSQVTLNLPLGKISTKVALYTTVTIPVCKYAVETIPIAMAIEEMPIIKNNQFYKFTSILIRTILLICTMITALSIPFFADVMAFIGSLLSVTVSFIMPCLCYLKIVKGARKFGVRFVLIIVIIVTGSFVAIVGTYVSLNKIVDHL